MLRSVYTSEGSITIYGEEVITAYTGACTLHIFMISHSDLGIFRHLWSLRVSALMQQRCRGLVPHQ